MPPFFVNLMLAIGLGFLGFFTVRRYMLEGPQRHGSNVDKNDYFSQPNDACAICLLDIGTGANFSYLSCGHAMHDKCLKEYKKHYKICPTCRQDL